MLTRWNLIELALGKDEARKVDTAIPQGVFDQMTETARQDVAGWYYAPEVKLMGRLLTQNECWTQIRKRIADNKLRITMMDHDITFAAADWPCLRSHAEKGELEIVEVEKAKNV